MENTMVRRPGILGVILLCMAVVGMRVPAYAQTQNVRIENLSRLTAGYHRANRVEAKTPPGIRFRPSTYLPGMSS